MYIFSLYIQLYMDFKGIYLYLKPDHTKRTFFMVKKELRQDHGHG